MFDSIMSNPSSSISRSDNARTVPRVATGMNAGVCMRPRQVTISPARAAESGERAIILKIMTIFEQPLARCQLGFHAAISDKGNKFALGGNRTASKKLLQKSAAPFFNVAEFCQEMYKKQGMKRIITGLPSPALPRG